ncbi:MAG TPA: hypothetical protein VGS57_07040 [Thermoanaerobaculia bacterium]|jgi:hypothetical protein|nr:hypothetical protein [Thermoanaerobaculia bacterium]
MLQRAALRALLVLGVLVVLMPAPAHAYLDPASGSMILQLVLGGAAGVAVAVRLLWRRLLRGLGQRDSPPPQ